MIELGIDLGAAHGESFGYSLLLEGHFVIVTSEVNTGPGSNSGIENLMTCDV